MTKLSKYCIFLNKCLGCLHRNWEFGMCAYLFESALTEKSLRCEAIVTLLQFTMTVFPLKTVKSKQYIFKQSSKNFSS